MKPMIKIQSAEKDNKKSIKRFYKANNYSASFMGYDTSYIALHEGEIIACVIISYISMIKG